jgi:alkylated DNA nucleotide flippase Atl1
MRSPHVKLLTTQKGPAYPAGRMLISSPEEIAAVVARVPKGRVLTLGTLRAHLAARHHADYTCPLTTGIFLRDLAAAGPVAPWWRVVRDNGALIDKLPAQAERLAVEGVGLAGRGNTKRVEDLEARQWDPR